MSAGLVRRIAESCPNMVVLKHEDWPGLDKITAIRGQEAAGARRLSILCGHGGIFLPHELARGADGAMTGFSFPEMLVDVCRLMREGEADAALDLGPLSAARALRAATRPRPCRAQVRAGGAAPGLRSPGARLSDATRARSTSFWRVWTGQSACGSMIGYL